MRRDERTIALQRSEHSDTLTLDSGSRIAVIGGGPAGSFFSYFVLEMADRVGLDVGIDIYEPRDFSKAGPQGCNMCGGIISETLVQNLAMEGINLPDTVVQRGIDSYVLHTDTGAVRIDTPRHEKRIAAVHRGMGPLDLKVRRWDSFDKHLQQLATKRGANLLQQRVEALTLADGRPMVTAHNGSPQAYDLVAAAVGVNSPALKLFETLGVGYQAPEATKTFIREYFIGEEIIGRTVGNSMHVFLLDIPRLEFAAVVPKGDYVSICLLGETIDKELTDAFLNSPEVRQCLPDGWNPDTRSCQCAPRINIKGAPQPFADRLVFIGDCGVTRLYKDGIGAAYRTAKAAATTVVFEGIDADSFRKHYVPACKAISRDNALGKIIFAATRQVQRWGLARRAILRMTEREQRRKGNSRLMSQILWDTFTGSGAYREIFLRAMHPAFLGGLLWAACTSMRGPRRARR